jgi:UDP-glucose 4-epimerase
MKTLITGNAGFLGSHLQDALIELGHDVIGIDSLVGGFKRNVNEKCKMYVHDLRDKDAVDSTFRINTPEIVYHLAADATEGRSQFTPISATENNLLASVNVFTSAIKYGAKRIIYTSSMSVYGGQEPPFDETMETQPVDVYGTNKAAAEHILKILCAVHVEYVIIRPHNVFGPRQNIRDAYRNVVGIFINRVMQNKPPIIYGDGEQVRSFTYIDNITPCFVRAMDAAISGETINVGPIETQTVNHLASTILKSFDSNLEPIHELDRPLEVKQAHCTNQKAIDLLGYETMIHFNDGIEQMVKWAVELGPQRPIYLDSLELPKNAPRAWTQRLQ